MFHQRHLVVGDGEWKDPGFCHSHHRTASQKRGEAEEDASENQTFNTLDNICTSWVKRSRFEMLPGLCSVLCLCAGWCLGDHSH